MPTAALSYGPGVVPSSLRHGSPSPEYDAGCAGIGSALRIDSVPLRAIAALGNLHDGCAASCLSGNLC